MRKLQLPLMFLMIVFISSVLYHIFYLDNINTVFSMESPFTLSFLIMAFSFFVLRFIDVFVWTRARDAGVFKIPRVFVDILNTLLITIVLIFLINKIFHRPITGILAASGALGVIIGLSMQRILADLFTGIAVNMDKTIKLSDWIEYYPRNREPILGQVKEVNWRTIKLLTYSNNIVVIPNGILAISIIKNLSMPSSLSMHRVNLTLDFEVPSARVLALLEAAVISVKEISEKPKPRIFIEDVSDRGVNYSIRFWLDINKINAIKGKHLVYLSALQHIHQSGLSLSYLKHDVFYKKMPKRQLDGHRDAVSLLQRVPLFKMLNLKEIDIIHKGLIEISSKSGESIVVSGSSGSSMFIVVEGVLDVFVDKITGSKIKRLKVSQLIPGDFFGEMSLLTGEPRSATIISKTNFVLFEIKKESIVGVLKDRPEVGAKLSKILADRIMSNKSAKIKYKDNKDQLESTLFSKMKEFFFGI